MDINKVQQKKLKNQKAQLCEISVAMFSLLFEFHYIYFWERIKYSTIGK